MYYLWGILGSHRSISTPTATIPKRRLPEVQPNINRNSDTIGKFLEKNGLVLIHCSGYRAEDSRGKNPSQKESALLFFQKYTFNFAREIVYSNEFASTIRLFSAESEYLHHILRTQFFIPMTF